jgi:hypothetical protein
LDDRQDNLGQMSTFQASQPQELRTGRKSWQRIRCRPSIIPVSQRIHERARASGSPCDDGLTARQTAARQKRKQKGKITQGGAYDE